MSAPVISNSSVSFWFTHPAVMTIPIWCDSILSDTEFPFPKFTTKKPTKPISYSLSALFSLNLKHFISEWLPHTLHCIIITKCERHIYSDEYFKGALINFSEKCFRVRQNMTKSHGKRISHACNTHEMKKIACHLMCNMLHAALI